MPYGHPFICFYPLLSPFHRCDGGYGMFLGYSLTPPPFVSNLPIRLLKFC